MIEAHDHLKWHCRFPLHNTYSSVTSMSEEAAFPESSTSVLAEVPPNIYAAYSAQAFNTAGRNKAQAKTRVYIAEFNIASWISFNEQPNDETSLWVQFTDAYGMRQAFIDKGNLNSAKSLMLSGKVALRFRGYISHMQIICMGGNISRENISVEELYVQAINGPKSVASTAS